MTIHKDKARLLWHCRRGMLELDLLLQKFMAESFDDLSTDEVHQFDQLLQSSDPELLSWLMGHDDPTDSELLSIVQRIRG